MPDRTKNEAPAQTEATPKTETRIFVKEGFPDRIVETPRDEVQAEWDGFVQK